MAASPLHEPPALGEAAGERAGDLFDDFEHLPGDLPADAPLKAAVDAFLAGQYDAALKEASVVLASDPRSAPALAIKAAALVKTGQEEEGTAVLENAPGDVPHPAALVRRIGDACLALDELGMAEAQFKRALARDPGDRLPHQRLGYIYDRTDRPDEAAVEYRLGLGRRSADYAGVNVLLGNLYNRWGRFADTAALLEEPVTADTTVPLAHTVLGVAYLGMEKVPEAIDTLETARELAPRNPRTLLALAFAHRGIRDNEVTREMLEQVVQVAPAWPHGHAYLGALELMERNPDAAVDCYRRAADCSQETDAFDEQFTALLLSLKRFDEAIPILERLLAMPDQPFSTYDALARAYVGSGEPETAEATLARALDAFPGDPEAMYRLGEVYNQRGKHEEAIALLLEALAMAPDNDNVLRTLGYGHAGLGQLAEAMSYAEQAVAALPERPDNTVLLAGLHMDSGDVEKAAALYKEVLRLDPWNVAAHLNLALMLLTEGDLRGAWFRASQIWLRNPDIDPVTGVSVAAIYRATGHGEDAVEIYEAVLAREPDNLAALNNLAILHADARGYARALEYAEKALSLAPDAGPVLDTLGWVHYRMGAIDPALQKLETAVEREPDNPSIRYHLAAAYNAAGRTEEAREQVATALGLSDTFPEYEDAVVLSDKLGP